MFKEATPLFLYAETSVHLGSGQALGAIDRAIQRERHTGYPVGAGSGMKGAVRDFFERAYEDPNHDAVLAAFGPPTVDASDHAGALAFTDARILLFPVRSVRGVFAWVTCPTVLARLQRDLGGTDAAKDKAHRVPSLAALRPQQGTAYGGRRARATLAVEDGIAVLESFAFPINPFDDGDMQAATGQHVDALATWLRDHALPDAAEYAAWTRDVGARLLVLHDDDFRDFVEHATEVQARIALNEEKTTGAGGNLFYQENLPSDSVLYSVVLAQDSLRGAPEGAARYSAQDLLYGFLRGVDGQRLADPAKSLDRARLQIGGDESVGKGIVYATFFRASTVAS